MLGSLPINIDLVTIRRQKGHIAKTLPIMTVFCLRRTGGRSMRLKRCRLCELRIKAGTE